MKPIMRVARRVALRVLTLGPVASIWSGFHGARTTILMFHRMENRSRNTRGYPAGRLKRMLAYLRRRKYQLVDLEEMIRRQSGEGPPLSRAVALTMDDGYLDQFEAAVPAFAEYDAPVTIFLPTGFIDRELWLWWDHIEYLFRHTRRDRLDIEVGAVRIAPALTTADATDRAIGEFTEMCKWVPDAQRLDAIRRLGAALEVELPAQPPAEYEPMTWDQARIAERYGFRFGPSTFSHPILSRVDDRTVEREIVDSWRRIQAETTRPMPVFCFPNGLHGDFGDREIRIMQREGLLGAVTAEPGYVSAREIQKSPLSRFRTPRFTAPDSVPHLIKTVSGLDRYFL